jgi:hypothetical protein
VEGEGQEEEVLGLGFEVLGSGGGEP